MHKRLKKDLVMLAVLLAAGVIYYFLTIAGFAIPCLIHYITGFYCPGCGVTRMCVNLIKLDFYSAFRSNPAIFIISPFLAFILIRQSYYVIKYGKSKHEKWITVIEIIIIIILLIFGILRNIPAFYYLRPL